MANITVDQERTFLTIHNGRDAVVATLTIENSTKSDEGEYTCQAESELVKQTGKITLVVEGDLSNKKYEKKMIIYCKKSEKYLSIYLISLMRDAA